MHNYCPTPTFAQLGISSPLFPMGLHSPHLGMASPALGALGSMSGVTKWPHEGIDLDVWFDGDSTQLGSMHDLFKDDERSIFHAQTLLGADHDDLVVAAR